MKTQKLEEASGLGIETGVATLVHSAQAHPEDADRAAARLIAVQELLSDDLRWVERALSEVVGQGEHPGTDAARHLLARGGKRVRPIALMLSAACFGAITPKVRELAVVAELIHSATLLHDDVVDEGSERRGAPTSRLAWGNAISVLSGDMLLVHALSRTQVHAPDLMPDLIQTLRRLVDGEIVQLRGRRELDVSEATYERILRDKTASLFAFATRAGARLAGASAADEERLGLFGERIGIAFQLIDDLLDYTGQDTGKALLTDLREGKLTLPLVLAAARMPELMPPLHRIFAGDGEPIRAVSQAVIASGACDEVRRRATDHTRRAVEQLDSLELGPARTLLENVARELAARAA
ncbi:MAG TPA: polyprenyl synthetase family protein [Polyangiaceae bacterium]